MPGITQIHEQKEQIYQIISSLFPVQYIVPFSNKSNLTVTND